MYYFHFSFWLLQLNWHLAVACEGDCAANLTKAYAEGYVRLANPVFAGLTRTIQTSLPNVTAGQVNAFIEPIRQKTYNAVHEEVKKGLQLISAQNANKSGTMNLTSDKLALSVLQVVNLVLNETLSAVSQTIATLGALDKKQPGVASSAPPVKVPAEVPPSPIKPMETPGRPFAVSTIPINAPGAPKLPKRQAHENTESREFSRSANSRENGKPQALSAHPASADFHPVPDAPVQDPCAIRLIENIICLRNLPIVSGILKRRSFASSKSPMPALLSSQHGQTFSSISKRSLGDEATLRGVPRIYILTDIQADELTSQGSPENLPDLSDEIEPKNVQSFHNPIQIPFHELDPGQEDREGRRRVESILQDAWRVFEARFKINQELLWETFRKEHLAPLN
ncbi:hypothetical protein, variant [Puccinia triticina 1-1 BBBD Race 1]|uniref:Uncharacterized protein n=2 Tax=Puccinia triticina TaxID=208348 RepID=A0A180GCT3_PUCT1|nr:uncharacterized protein PtA15_1A17 [Puccinia triticina]OAV90470.1 hypothetical protein, variant [Puccinia triticina 1-1 BBBD Race 1]WAQ80679.1 hypothetical protein PtA15_1A17 [Puccinia triticina]WAR51570.1 hypothetical protein PtB15_1B6 [Puccinia triticina]